MVETIGTIFRIRYTTEMEKVYQQFKVSEIET